MYTQTGMLGPRSMLSTPAIPVCLNPCVSAPFKTLRRPAVSSGWTVRVQRASGRCCVHLAGSRTTAQKRQRTNGGVANRERTQGLGEQQQQVVVEGCRRRSSSCSYSSSTACRPRRWRAWRWGSRRLQPRAIPSRCQLRRQQRLRRRRCRCGRLRQQRRQLVVVREERRGRQQQPQGRVVVMGWRRRRRRVRQRVGCWRQPWTRTTMTLCLEST